MHQFSEALDCFYKFSTWSGSSADDFRKMFLDFALARQWVHAFASVHRAFTEFHTFSTCWWTQIRFSTCARIWQEPVPCLPRLRSTRNSHGRGDGFTECFLHSARCLVRRIHAHASVYGASRISHIFYVKMDSGRLSTFPSYPAVTHSVSRSSGSWVVWEVTSRNVYENSALLRWIHAHASMEQLEPFHTFSS